MNEEEAKDLINRAFDVDENHQYPSSRAALDGTQLLGS